MKIDDKLIYKISNLAKLEFDKNSTKKMKKDLSKILDYINKIQKLNTHKIKPLINTLNENPKLREDNIQQSLKKEEALRNAPLKDSDYFKVPKFIKW